MIGQNGRRGALMISMDIRHPDVEKFVTMKHDLTKVTGANVSVKISDEFMEAVQNNESFTLRFPVDAENPKYTREIDAASLWKQIVESATKTAEPGLLMWGNIEKYLPAESYADDGFKTICTNPCGEIPLSAYDSCRLISVNLKNFVKNPFTETAFFDFDHFSQVAGFAMRLSDDLVELEVEKLDNIIKACDTPDEVELWENLKAACVNGRRTGLGTHGLADALACLSLAYDSDEAIEVIDNIYSTFKVAAYTESVNLAQERGAFPVFNWDKEKDNAYIQSLPKNLQELIAKFGRRNISILTNAPTGSVSIMSQTSSGIEPVFRNSYTRRRKLSHNETDIKADFIDDLGDKWTEYEVFHHNVRAYLEANNTTEVPDFFTESDAIDWETRVRIQATIQKHIDHSISSTINLPKGTDPEVVSRLYQLGWKLGLKGITVYVDGSRTGVLVTNTEEEKESFPQHQAVKRPAELSCNIHHTTIQGEKWIILVGMLDGKPYEVMGGLSNLIEIPAKHTQGILVKHPRKTMNSVYDLRVGKNGDTIVVKDIVKVFDNPNYAAFTRLISLSLRHGASIQYVVEQMQKDRDSDMFSFAKCVARVLKNYITDGTAASDKVCTECGSDGLVYLEGCLTCRDCGYSKCG
jgi:ribonucleoside-diphosphate reductase alpha chain